MLIAISSTLFLIWITFLFFISFKDHLVFFLPNMIVKSIPIQFIKDLMAEIFPFFVKQISLICAIIFLFAWNQVKLQLLVPKCLSKDACYLKRSLQVSICSKKHTQVFIWIPQLTNLSLGKILVVCQLSIDMYGLQKKP